MKNIILLLLAIAIFWLGKIFAMILIYASPDNTPHLFDASIYFLGSSFFIFALYFNLDNKLHSILKWLFVIFGIYTIFDSIVFILISLYGHPIPNTIDINAGISFMISTLFLSCGLYFMFKNNIRKAENA